MELPIELRTLTQEEIPAWGHFVATRGFGHRPGAVDRFTLRFLQDPHATLRHIIAAYALRTPSSAAPELVGCVRLFYRTLALCGDGSSSAPVIGWGEVCSDPDLRGKGIVGRVLREAKARMQGQDACACPGAAPAALALLHSAPSVSAMYARLGFAATLPIPYGQLPLGSAALEGLGEEGAPLPGHPRTRLRAVDFQADWQALEALRAAQAARLGLVGWAQRSQAYWQQWVSNAAKGAARVLEVQRSPPASSGAWQALAYGYARWREGAWRAMDWAACSSEEEAEAEGEGGGQGQLLPAFARHLLAAGVAQAAAAGDATPVPPSHPSQLLPSGQLALVMPLALLAEVGRRQLGQEALGEVQGLRDVGWMAMSLPSGGEGEGEGEGGAGGGSAAAAEGAGPTAGPSGALQTLQAAAAAGKFIVFGADNI